MKGLPRSNSRGKPQLQAVRRQRVIMKDVALTVNGATGVGFGSVVIGDFPEGNILFLGAISYIQLTKNVATGVQDTFDGDYSIGSAPTADVTLSGSEIDLIPSTAFGVATAGVSPTARGANATQVMLDNTDGSLEFNLNVLIDDANISADAQTLKVNGFFDLVYSVLGDD